MKVEDIVRVVGRGHIVCSHLDGRTIRVGDKVMAGYTEFEVRGIERWSYSKSIGLILSPNTSVPGCFRIGDEIKFSEAK